MAMFGAYCKRMRESLGSQNLQVMVRESFAERKVRQEDIHLKEIAESTCGPDWARILQARWQGGVNFREATEAVDASAFADITGQLLIQKAHEMYTAAEFVLSGLIGKEQITNGNLGPQREPWLGKLSTGPRPVNQGQNYPASFFGENYIDMPAPIKWGQICRVTFEMVFSDLTKQAFDAAGGSGERQKILEEESATNVFYGLSAASLNGFPVDGDNHVWNGTAYNTYQSSTPWINTIGSLQVLDWTQLNTIEQLFINMLDPQTGKPITVRPTAVLVSPYKRNYWKRIANATNTRQGFYPTSGGANTLTDAPSPLDRDYPIYASPYAYQFLIAASGGALTSTQAQEYVVLADFARAFLRRYLYLGQIVEAPPENPEQFNADIVWQQKCSSFFVDCVYDPRFAVLTYNT